MSINKSEQSLEDKLINDVTDLKRDMREIKSRQPIGSDILQVKPIPSAGALAAGPITVPAGNTLTFIVQFTPDTPVLTIWNILHTIFIDANDVAHQYPGGASLTLAQRTVTIVSWMDWADSSDVTNTRVYKIHIRNQDSVSHDYYLAVRAYLPTLGVSTS